MLRIGTGSTSGIAGAAKMKQAAVVETKETGEEEKKPRNKGPIKVNASDSRAWPPSCAPADFRSASRSIHLSERIAPLH